MNTTILENKIAADKQISPSSKVIYLEGKTDIKQFFALLGVEAPTDGIHQDVLVKECGGSKNVESRLSIATNVPYPDVFGVIDGDGRGLADLALRFDAPFQGPLFTWKAYCIENLVVKTGWPLSWGPLPDWEAELLKYGPYVAIRLIQREIRSVLNTLSIEQYLNPSLGNALKRSRDVLDALEADKHLLQGYDVAQKYQDYFNFFMFAVENDLDQAHAMLDGKWLVRHFAPERTKIIDTSRRDRTPDECRQEWIAHAISVGGLPAVRDFWQRVTGRAP